MGEPLIQDEDLQPGTLLDLNYEISGGGYLSDQAISAAKRAAADDPRWHYQGSEIQNREDGFGMQTRFLVITVQAADPSKVVDPTLDRDRTEQQAGVLLSVGIIVGVIGAAVIAWKGELIYRDYVVKSVVENPNVANDVKVAALNALGQKTDLASKLAAAGGSVVTVALILSGLYIYFRFRGQSGAAASL